ncbi:MAG TPA: hypothetical protein VE397_18335 [Stellaceae bacterium]|jgi:hypothetical protein|nr:hypothetical protein [Stellaceae bacterium]
MRVRNHLRTVWRAADFVVLAVFLGLAAFAYDRLFTGFGEVANGGEFTDFYRPGDNPWSGPIIAPAPDEGRFARLAPADRPYR